MPNKTFAAIKEIGLTETDATEAQNLGAKGVPFFVINRKYAIAGAQAPAEILKALQTAYSEWKKDHPGVLQTSSGASCTPGSECIH